MSTNWCIIAAKSQDKDNQSEQRLNTFVQPFSKRLIFKLRTSCSGSKCLVRFSPSYEEIQPFSNLHVITIKLRLQNICSSNDNYEKNYPKEFIDHGTKQIGYTYRACAVTLMNVLYSSYCMYVVQGGSSSSAGGSYHCYARSNMQELAGKMPLKILEIPNSYCTCFFNSKWQFHKVDIYFKFIVFLQTVFPAGSELSKDFFYTQIIIFAKQMGFRHFNRLFPPVGKPLLFQVLARKGSILVRKWYLSPPPLKNDIFPTLAKRRLSTPILLYLP